MYVVKRHFKSLGKVYTAGSVIAEPASVKHFKSKLASGKILCVTEQTYEAARAYFKDKYGVDLPPLAAKEEKTPEAPQDEAKADEAHSVAKAAVKVKVSK